MVVDRSTSARCGRKALIDSTVESQEDFLMDT